MTRISCAFPGRLLDLVRPEVEATIFELRPWREPLRVNWIAAKLNVEVIDHEFRGPVQGATIDDRVILLEKSLRGSRRSEVFGHEVAHVLRRRGFFPALPSAGDELFADQFARELLAPVAWLGTAAESATTLARKLRIGRPVLAMQLSLLGRAPDVMRDRDAVLCSVCGIQPHDRFCRCRAYRQDRWQRRTLKDFRDLPAFRQVEDGQLVLTDEFAIPDIAMAA